MLSDSQILDNKQQYITLLMDLEIDITKFLQYLESDRCDFFNKAYDVTKFPYQGSLCEHAIKLYNKLLETCEHYFPGMFDRKDIIKVALLKDLYRAELYEPYLKNVKNEETNQWQNQLAYRQREIRPIFGDISFSSYMIAKKFIELDNDEVVEAICYSSPGSSNIDIYNIRKTYKLVTLTAIAELMMLIS